MASNFLLRFTNTQQNVMSKVRIFFLFLLVADSPALDTLCSHCIVLHIWFEVAVWWIHAWRRVRFLTAAKIVVAGKFYCLNILWFIYLLSLELNALLSHFRWSVSSQCVAQDCASLSVVFWNGNLGWVPWISATKFLNCSRRCLTNDQFFGAVNLQNLRKLRLT